jgi:D-alanyl-D-alanine carboxypeptidase
MPFATRFDRFSGTGAAVRRRLPLALLILPAFLLVACGQPAGYGLNVQQGETAPAAVPQQYYPPPGPPEDPWGPYIREAAARYRVPEQWVRAVMQQESGGQEQAVSPVGAMGLMQIMPETYEGLQERYGFGADPFDPHNNILAGTAYIREMYDLFGSPGFLAAYNAGPDRMDDYLAGTARLPTETVNYLAAVAPNLGGAVSPSGPLAAYAFAPSTGGFAGASVASLAAGCDLNAAYDPNHPCSSLEEAAVTGAPPPPQMAAQDAGVGGCDLNMAYDPSHPCASRPQALASAAPTPVATASSPAQQVAAAAVAPPLPSEPPAPRLELAAAEECDPDAAYDPDRPCRMPFAPSDGMALRLPHQRAATETRFSRYRAAAHHLPPVAVRGEWAIQVGAFASPALARAVAEGARHQAPKELRYAALTLPPTSYRHEVLYRARLAHLSAKAAAAACSSLNRRQLPCIIVRPSRI